MTERLSCALDLSGPFASFAVAEGDKVLLADSFVLQNRNNVAFFKCFFSALSEAKIEASEIGKWIVGIGPGSFTGLRIASSFISGIIYGTDKKAVGISSAFPIAMDIKSSSAGENIGVLFPCSKDTLYLCSMVLEKDNSWAIQKSPECISKRELINTRSYSSFVALSVPGEEHNLKQTINCDIPITFLNKFPIEKMFCNFDGHYTNINDLLYIRPPSLTIKI